MQPSQISTATLTRPWRIRAAQLDLGRQRETLESIGQFIRFIKNWGFNTLVLYLEGAVRTRSFPYRPRNRSYSLDDMRQVVAMAAKAGIEVVPCIATLGHTELFLSCKQMAHLREVTSSTNQLMFCPSNEKVYEFLERYLAEIASVFPSRHFHIGCDEAWPLGTCPTCHDRLVRGETHEDLFIGHITRVRGILNKLGKRTWIWDDMLENVTEEKFKKEVPRDIVMCAWHYGSELVDYGSLPGHFNNLRRRDWLTFYESAGYDVLICPAISSFENVMAVTQVARQHRVLGGLQTMWELSTGFLPGTLPGEALAGALWSQPYRAGEEVLQETLQRLFPNVDPTARAALSSTAGDVAPGYGSAEQYLSGPMTMEERRGFRSVAVYERLVASQLPKLPPGLERDILEEWHAILRMKILAGRQRELLPALVDPRIRIADRAAQWKLAEWCLKEMDAFAESRAKDWKRYRPGIGPDLASASWRDAKKSLAAFLRKARQTPPASKIMLNVRLFLWDGYSWPRLTIELGAKGKWRTVSNSTHKPVNLRDALYSIQVPVQWTGPDPDRIRFTVSLFGGQGVTYAELCYADRTLVPSAVSGVGGEVSNPLALLVDDSSACYLGHPDTARTYEMQTEHARSWIEATLAPKKKLSGPIW